MSSLSEIGTKTCRYRSAGYFVCLLVDVMTAEITTPDNSDILRKLVNICL